MWKAAWHWTKQAATWLLGTLLFLVLLPAGIIYLIWQISPFGKKAKDAPASSDVKPHRPDVVSETAADIESHINEEKEKDHEKTLSGIVNDAGGFVDGQPVTISRSGYFNITDAD